MEIVFIIFGIIILSCVGLAVYTIYGLLKTVDKMSELIKAENLQDFKESESGIEQEDLEDDNISSVYEIDEKTAKELAVKIDFTK